VTSDEALRRVRAAADGGVRRRGAINARFYNQAIDQRPS